MKMSKIAMVFSCSLLLLPMSRTPAQPATTSLDTLKSVRDFVNEFYSWYVSTVRKSPVATCLPHLNL
jgi:hypothetical protein